MPHCIIEHSAEIDEQALMNAVYQGALKSALFEDHDIKLRTISYTHYQAGPSKQSFIHVTCKILSGRTITQRTQLSALIITQLQQFSNVADSVTIEIVEIERASYQKFIRASD